MSTDRELVAHFDRIAMELALLEDLEAGLVTGWQEVLTRTRQWAQAGGHDELDACVGTGLAAVEALVGLASQDDPGPAIDGLGVAVGQIQQLIAAAARTAVAGANADAAAGEGAAFDDVEIFADFVDEGTEKLIEVDVHLLALEKAPDDATSLHAAFACFHTLKGTAGFLQLGDIERLSHATEDVLDQARQQKCPLTGAVMDVTFEAVGLLKVLVKEIESAADSGTWHQRSRATVEDLVARIGMVANSGTAVESSDLDLPFERSASAESAVPAASGGVPLSPGAPQARGAKPTAGAVHAHHESLRIDAERLDAVIAMVGELVIAQSLVQCDVEQALHSRAQAGVLTRSVAHLGKIVGELQGLAGGLRMVPVQSAFRKMARLARDVGREFGRELEFECVGEETELDKILVDRLGDILGQLVRNAVQHGLEGDPARRAEAGKPRVGRIELRAYRRGSNVHVEVWDDGRGVDRPILREIAVRRGQAARAALTDRDVVDLLCQPGLAMDADAPANSGHGMSAVRADIEAMGGVLSFGSTLGEGTCWSMKLPLRLAVIDGMVLRLAGERYVIPTLSVVRLVTPKPSDFTVVAGRGQILRVQDRLIPVLEIGALFGVTRQRARKPLAIVVEAAGVQMCFMIDELVGQQQAVIKSVGLGDMPGLAGCAILDDGRVGLVLDVAGLVRLVRGSSAAAGASRPARARGAVPSSRTAA